MQSRSRLRADVVSWAFPPAREFRGCPHLHANCRCTFLRGQEADEVPSRQLQRGGPVAEPFAQRVAVDTGHGRDRVLVDPLAWARVRQDALLNGALQSHDVPVGRDPRRRNHSAEQIDDEGLGQGNEASTIRSPLRASSLVRLTAPGYEDPRTRESDR